MNMAKILIVEARFYAHLNDLLLAGARAAIEQAGHSHETITVPARSRFPAPSRWRSTAAAGTVSSPWASSSAARLTTSRSSPAKARAASWR